VTFTAGTLTTSGVVSATVTGDFGPVQWVDGGGTGSGSGSGTVTNNIVPGTYTLTYHDPAEIDCFGPLVGHEGELTSTHITILGFVPGPVIVTTPSPTTTDVDGSVIASAFGSTPLELDASSDAPGNYAAVTSGSGAGPDATQLAGKYLALDGADATPTF